MDVDTLERKMFHEKERIKKEFLIKIKETKQNLLSMTEDQLHTTTKRTIMENEQMTTELQYQSRETEQLLKMNTKLRFENKELQRNVHLTEEAGREYGAWGRACYCLLLLLLLLLLLKHYSIYLLFSKLTCSLFLFFLSSSSFFCIFFTQNNLDSWNSKKNTFLSKIN